MGTKTASGFTIIEVMLFLAVTGALAVGILVGSGVAIGQQRYRDSVNSLKSIIQEQYNEATNVVNSRSGSEGCSTSATVTTPLDSPGTNIPLPRGQADCLLMGRSITISTDGTKVTTANVIGYRKPDAGLAGTNDVDELGKYALAISPIDQESRDVEWGARVVTPRSANPQSLSMLILRSPLSGSTMAFVSNTETDLSKLVKNNSNYSAVDLCVEGAAGSSVGSQLAVRINPYASSSSAIEIPTESDHVCG